MEPKHECEVGVFWAGDTVTTTTTTTKNPNHKLEKEVK